MSNGAKLILDILVEANIKEVFGYPGGAVIPLYDEIYQHKGIKHYLVRHEQAAAHAAEAYGKTKNYIGCCISTSGPGATNLVTGIANAHMDSNPLLCITGQVAQSVIGKMSFQEVDIVSIVQPITKKAVQIKDVSELPAVMFDLINTAMDKRKGPVLMDVPKDVFLQECDCEELLNEFKEYQKNYNKVNIKIKDEDVDKVISYLNKSKKPVFLIGAGVLNADCEKEITQIIKYFKIPTVTTLHALGVGATTKYYYGMAGMHGSVIANKALYNADLVVSFGSRFDDRLVGNNKKFASYGKKIHIDIDPRELGKNVKTNLMIRADLKDFLTKLMERSINIEINSWILQLNQFKKEVSKQKDSNIETELHPKQLFDTFNNLNKDIYYVTDVGQHQMWGAQYIKPKFGNRIVTSGGLGTMGFGLPASLGVCVAHKDKDVVAFVGDGGFQMTLQELSTVKEYNLNVKIVILNNSRLGMVRQWQKHFHDSRYSSTVLNYNPSFEKLAQAYKINYLKVENCDELYKIEKVFNYKQAFLIEVIINEELDVLPMIPANQSFEEIIL